MTNAGDDEIAIIGKSAVSTSDSKSGLAIATRNRLKAQVKFLDDLIADDGPACRKRRLQLNRWAVLAFSGKD